MSIKHILLIWILFCITAIAGLESDMWQRIQEGSTIGWSVHYTGQDVNDVNDFDEFESVATVNGDEVWVVTERDSNQYIEQFQPLDFGDQNDAWFVDCGGDERYLWHDGVSATYEDGEYTEFFVGIYYSGAENKDIVNATTESAIDTTWGTDGYFNVHNDAYVTRDMYQLDDGRMIVLTDTFVVGGTTMMGGMINTDGTLDDDWGSYNGYVRNRISNNAHSILEDDDGNFHIFGTGSTCYAKIDSDGELITNLSDSECIDCADAAWADDDKTRIIVVGSYNIIGGKAPNIIAINPSDGTVDTTFTGNLSMAGYAQWGIGTILYTVRVLSDGGFVISQNSATDTVCKFLSDGSGFDTSWGDGGTLDVGEYPWGGDIPRMVLDGDEIYHLSSPHIPSIYARLTHIDSTGTVVNQNQWYTGSNQRIHFIGMINEKLVLGGLVGTGCTNNVMFYDTDTLEYESGFDITGIDAIYYVLPDETTREQDVNTPAVAAYWETVDVNYSRIEGRYACVFADGESEGSYLVTDGNLVGIDSNDYSNFLAGLNYYSIYESFPLIAKEIVKNQKTSVQRIAMDLYETYGLNLGTDMSHSSGISFVEMYTGYKIAEFPRGTTREPVVYLWEWEPVPWTLRGLYLHEEISME